MFNLNFFTKRLLLRPFSEKDLDLMQALDLDAEVVRYLGHGKPKSKDYSCKSLNKILKDYREHGLGLFAVYEKETSCFVGRAGLIPWKFEEVLTWEVGYSFVKSAWGKGYGTEVALYLTNWAKANLQGTSHLISIIHPENVRSIHVAEKIGMRFSKKLILEDHPELVIYRLDFNQFEKVDR